MMNFLFNLFYCLTYVLYMSIIKFVVKIETSYPVSIEKLLYSKTNQLEVSFSLFHCLQSLNAATKNAN